MRLVHQHRLGDVSGFTERYNLNRLVYYDPWDVVEELAQREEGREGPGPFAPYRGISKGCRAGTVERPSRRRRWVGGWGMMNPMREDLAESVLGLGAAPAPG